MHVCLCLRARVCMCVLVCVCACVYVCVTQDTGGCVSVGVLDGDVVRVLRCVHSRACLHIARHSAYLGDVHSAHLPHPVDVRSASSCSDQWQLLN